ncbi:hypothetical protein V5F49_05060 [Xanthobacter sp. V3C-3]|uniref:hypothetical protein n=1 Tax=Xanthobacter lutulentifluminis TaxID=3119935 RepID=UPI00372C60FC
MGSIDRLADALAAVRARHAQQDDEEDAPVPVDPGEVDEEAEEAADLAGLEDSYHRSRDANLSRADLIDYAQFRGVRLTSEEQSAPMAELRKVILERLASIARH